MKPDDKEIFPFAQSEPAPPHMNPLERETRNKPKVTEQDKENFFKAFLSEKPYEEDVALFGGKYNVRFTTMSVAQNNEIFNQILLDQKKGLAANHDSYLIRVTLYRLGLSIVTLNGEPFAPEITKEKVKLEDKDDNLTYIFLKANVFDKWPVFKLSGILEAFRIFEQRHQLLTQEADNPDFWKAAV